MANPDWELRSRLQAYLLGEGDLREFQEWFVPFIWGQDRDASKMARSVELFLAEYTSGHRSEPELRSLFLEALVGTTSADLSETEDWTAGEFPFVIEEQSLTKP